MIARRALVGASGFAVVGASLPSRAQVRGKVYRVGVMSATVRLDHPDAAFVWDPFLTELQRRGWSEGRNVVFEHRAAEGNDDRWPQLARELIDLEVDVICVGSGTGALAVKAATRTVPIVFTVVPDPLGQGIVASLARPEANLTGVGTMSLELAGKRLELLKQAFPRIARVALLPYLNEATDEVHRANGEQVHRAGRMLGVQVLQARVQRAEDLEPAITALRHADAWYVQDDIFYTAHAGAVLELLAAQRKPVIYPQTLYVEHGGVMSYAVDLPDQLRRAAIYVDRNLRGAKPGDLPVELPRRFELAFNLKTVKAFGLTIPKSVLSRADKVFE